MNYNYLLKNVDEKYFRIISNITKIIEKNSGVPYLVGGAVRDLLLDKPIKDFDIEVYGIEALNLQNILLQNYELEKVGKSFTTFVLKGLPIEISLPYDVRIIIDNKNHKYKYNPQLNIKNAAERRDLTINSLMLNLITGELFDYFGGLNDIKNKILKHTSDYFAEDKLRVLRIMQFAGRLGFNVHSDTVSFCSNLSISNISYERVYKEWEKFILKSTKPSLGLKFLKESNWIKYFFETDAFNTNNISSNLSKETDVFEHLCNSMDYFANMQFNNNYEKLLIGLSVLTHILVKEKSFNENNEVNKENNEKNSQENNEKNSEIFTTKKFYNNELNKCLSFLKKVTNNKKLINEVLPLIDKYKFLNKIVNSQSIDSDLRNLSSKVSSIYRLIKVYKSIYHSLNNDDLHNKFIERIKNKAKMLGVLYEPPKPIITGEHIAKYNIKQGPNLGNIKNKCYKAQLNGEFYTLEKGLIYLNNIVEEYL